MQSLTGLVSYRKAQLEWNRARERAQTELELLSDMVIDDEDLWDDPDYDAVVACADELSSVLPDFDGALEELMDQLDTTVDESRHALLVQQAIQKLSEYREILRDSGLAQLQARADEAYGGGLSFLPALEGALGKIHLYLVGQSTDGGDANPLAT
ncbi:hypothetical protein [Bradyrhizobium sp. SZCCHNS3051]|uniref:hypothetical protein n=1 Tax=Bradyrhizobium sp. SZCCHNS3051 TaxID=3057320 RepID=UPI002915CA5C|nr:hypothetical protein [Bradyrhizobium sp. SZCCHNS3051]